MNVLKEENGELRERLGMDSTDVGLWLTLNPQDTRDRLAARALIAEWGNPYNALLRLGIQATKGDVESLSEQVFKTEGCQSIMHDTLSDDEAYKRIINRQKEIAQFGDNDQSVRAAQVLGKFLGWQKLPDTVIDNRRQHITLQQIVNPADEAIQSKNTKELPAGIVDAADFLSHEPGAATRISTDEKLDSIIESDEED